MENKQKPEDTEAEELYRARVERAHKSSLSLDLDNLNLEQELPSGAHDLKAGKDESGLCFKTPRAQSDAPITVRGAPKQKTEQMFVS